MAAFHHSRKWRKIRELKLRKDPLCELCLMRGITRAATDVHHILRVEDHPEEAMNLLYLQSLCSECHGQIGGTVWHKRRGGL